MVKAISYWHIVAMIILTTPAMCLLDVQITPPQKRLVKHFINLTNGLEIVPDLQKMGVSLCDLNYIRIQSTHCENSNYYGIMESLDNNFLMHAALGNICLLYDYGSRGTGALIGTEDHRSGIPRAYWWGVEWIRHCLAHVWNLDEAHQAKRNVRGYNSKGTFDEQIDAMPKTLRRKLKYFRPFLNTQALHIYPLYAKTVHDGEKDFYFQLFRQLNECQGLGAEDGGVGKGAVVELSESEVEEHVLRNIPPGMHLYRNSDFLNIGNNKKNDG